MKRLRIAKTLILIVFVWLAVFWVAPEPQAQSVAAEAASQDGSGQSVAAEPADAKPAEQPAQTTEAAGGEDKAAQVYVKKCAGCHTIGKGRLTGPDLNESIGWAEADLSRAIKAMEKNVGPMSDEEVKLLVDFLKDPGVKTRLKAEEERLTKMLAASFAPASAAIGEALYTGRIPLQNGGLACAACHSVTGATGMLGPDLGGVYQKLGEAPLQSAIEKANFKVMNAAYVNNPVTKQEAIHLTAYFKSIQQRQASAAPVFLYGTAGAAACLIVLGLLVRNRAADTRKKLVRRRRNVVD